MKTSLQRIEVQDGCRKVNGRPHGFRWRPVWQVTVTFDSIIEAEEFLDSINSHSKIKQRPAERI